MNLRLLLSRRGENTAAPPNPAAADAPLASPQNSLCFAPPAVTFWCVARLRSGQLNTFGILVAPKGDVDVDDGAPKRAGSRVHR